MGMMTVGGVSAVVKVFGIVKGSIIARQFGLSAELDAFYIAFLVPSFICDLFAGATVVALVPLYVRTRERDGSPAAQKLFGNILSVTAIGLIVLSIVMWVISPLVTPLFAESFGIKQVELTRSLITLLILLVPLSGISASLLAVLTARRHFAVATVSPAITTSVIIIAVYAFTADLGVYAFALGIVVGTAVQVVILAIWLRFLGLSPVLGWAGFTPETRSFLKQLTIVAVGSSIINLIDVVDQYSAGWSGPENLSALNYGNKFSLAIVGFGTVAVSTAILPHLSEVIAASDFLTTKYLLRRFTVIGLVLLIPLTLLLMLWSPTIVRVLFERGAFTSQDTLRVAQIQQSFLLQIPLHVVGMLFVSTIWAIRANWVFLLLNPICLGLKIVLNTVLVGVYGVAGIGLATSVTYSVSGLLLLLTVTVLMRKEARRAHRARELVATESDDGLRDEGLIFNQCHRPRAVRKYLLR